MVGLLVGVIMDLGMITVAVLSWIRSGQIKNDERQYLGEAVGFLVLFVVAGALLGWVGARLAIILDRYRRHGS